MYSKVKNFLQNGENKKALFFYATLISAMLFFVLLQPLGEPPDEANHYLIVQYICLHGTIPHGADPEILIFGYGGSYAYQPILTYIIQGYLLRFLFGFCKDGYLLLLAARLVNVVFGIIMAVYVRKTAKLLFRSASWQWLFSILIMFLPQSLFLHTYVNTDSMAMMSTAIMVYAWLNGYRTHWNRTSCLTLAAGISFCALSYYNAYGFILCSILFFIYTWFEKDSVSGKRQLNWKGMLRYGLFISAVVLLCISWWFIRNAVLYNGDFLGLAARAKCTLETATEQYHPLTKKTYYNTGYSLFYMIFRTDFLELLTNSTIATFGPMSIVTFKHIYTVIKWLTVLSLAAVICIPKRLIQDVCPKCHKADSASALCPAPPEEWDTADRRALYVCMLSCIVITVSLCVGYSYLSDYQPQGRYILPMLVPFAYFMTLGMSRIAGLLQAKLKIRAALLSRLPSFLTTLVALFYFYALWITLIRVVFPVYYPTSILYYIRNLI
ncbi:MAG: hypothetical protein GX234_00465 [Clostridiales bacterium]|nr:hypothetical protein [Clostridiales bacterium]